MIKGPGFQSHLNCHLLASCLTLTKSNLGKFYDLEVRSFEQLVPMTWQWLEFCTSASWQDSRQVLRRSFLKQSMELSSCLQVLLCFQWDPDESIVGHGKRTLDQLPDAGTPKKCEKPRNRISLIHWLDFSISQDGLVMLHKKQLHLHGRLKKKMTIPWLCYLSILNNQESSHHNLWELRPMESDCLKPCQWLFMMETLWPRSFLFYFISILLTRIAYVALWTEREPRSPILLPDFAFC